MTPSPRRRPGLRVLGRFACASLLLTSLSLSRLAHAEGDLQPIHLHIAGHELAGKISPLADDDQIYVPLETLNAVGARGKLNRREDAVEVTVSATGRQAELAIARPDGDPMIALSDLAKLVNADIVRTERLDDDGQPIHGSKGDTVYLLARITDVHMENGTIHITTSFPVSYQVRMLRDVTPPRGYIDCIGSDMSPDFHCAALPDGERRATRLRAGQFSIDTARVVLEMTAGAALKPCDGVCDANGAISADLLGRRRTRRINGQPGSDDPSQVASADTQRQKPNRNVGGAAQQPSDLDHSKVPDKGEPASIQRSGMPTGENTEESGATSPDNKGVTSDETDQNQNPLPSRGGVDRTAPAALEVRGLEFLPDSDTQVHVQITTNRRVDPYVHYLDGSNLAIDIPGAVLNLSDNSSSQKLPHPLLTGIEAAQVSLNPPVTRITLITSRVVGFTTNINGGTISLELRLPRNATGALADKLIVIDPGHGGPRTGATAGPIMEKNITLAIALKLRADLEACGARVVMTRDRDVDVGLDDRPNLANSIHADLFVSIHNDSNGVPNSASGTSTYYHMQDPSCRALAQCVQREILAVSGLPSRGVLSDHVMYEHGFAVLRLCKMPAILIEVAYINNHRDRLHLLDENFQQRVAKAICNGLRDYVEGHPETAFNAPGSDPGSDPTLMVASGGIRQN